MRRTRTLTLGAAICAALFLTTLIGPKAWGQVGVGGVHIARADMLQAIHLTRTSTNRIRAAKCLPLYRFGYVPVTRYPGRLLKSGLRTWQAREHAARKADSICGRTPQLAIRHVFGAYGRQAISVARCESGLRVYARNGQYLGLFQMGDYARSTYGHSWTAIGQARAARAYFVASGRDWSPWSCRP